MSVLSRRVLTPVLAVLSVSGLLAVDAAAAAARTASAASVARPGAAAAGQPCQDTSVPPTVEEARLTRTAGADPAPVPERILAASGFDRLVTGFERSLCLVRDPASASAAAEAGGRLLWEAATARARHAAGSGSAVAGDDRPLYWARLAMTLALRRWTPAFPVDAALRTRLEHRFEYASRGITSTGFSVPSGTRKLLVSGFDPFLLDTEIRRGNPAGASVLALDGRTVTVDGTPVQVQAVVFPVRFGDFDRGMVEETFRPHLAADPGRVDLFVTVSQGRVGAFDLEVWNGRRRSAAAPDNLNVFSGGTATAPVVPPGMPPGPEFVASTLPHQRMLAADGAPFTVRRNPQVVEIPAGGTGPVTRPDGPTPGSVAVQGSGGGYLSNEVAYRTTLLRDTLAAGIPGGHVHTPVLDLDPGNTAEITDPVFERNRADIVRQSEQLLRLAAGS